MTAPEGRREYIFTGAVLDLVQAADERKVERPLMEYSQGGAEVRRLHIVYFLSRNGRIEHPHLIRVHHLSRNGVHLREISYAEKKVPMQNKPSLEEDAEDKKPSEIQNQSETSTDVSTKSSSEIEEESTIFGSDTSTLTDDSGKLEVEKKQTSKQDIIHDQQDQSFKLMDNKMKHKVKIKKIDLPASSMKSSESCFTKGTSRSTGGSHKLRNLITCRALDTNDSAHVVMINRHNNQNNVHLMCKLGEKHIGGSQRISGTTWNQQPWNTGRQCKKQFNPEKLHAHMKSCKGIKATEKTSQRSIQFLATTGIGELVRLEVTWGEILRQRRFDSRVKKIFTEILWESVLGVGLLALSLSMRMTKISDRPETDIYPIQMKQKNFDPRGRSDHV
ncbi:uncharacterized protein Fot_28100 [Forsythia ovata]|uniref:SOSEKI DIX-like domain-containing protein n=1 Tax=Forsythia ovata TaxID=205694 RepID=A0ABD1TN43_9LAMI